MTPSRVAPPPTSLARPLGALSAAGVRRTRTRGPRSRRPATSEAVRMVRSVETPPARNAISARPTYMPRRWSLIHSLPMTRIVPHQLHESGLQAGTGRVQFDQGDPLGGRGAIELC